METNIHHEHWNRREHNKFKLSTLIRAHELSKVELIVPIHNSLHEYCPPVKAPVANLARIVLSKLDSFKGSYTSLDATKSLRDDLYDTEGDYLAQHLDRQIPFIELSMRTMKQLHIK